VRQRLGWWIVVALLAAGCAAPRSLRPVATDQTDVWFMQHMVPYLRQTTVVVSLTREHLTDPGLARLAATVIRRGQADIDQLQRWLDQRGLSPHGHSHQRADTPKQTDLERLARLRGSALDLAFVQVMTARFRTTSELAATEAHDGSLPEVRQLANQMVVEHQAQIAKMTAWKRAWSKAHASHPDRHSSLPSRADGRQERSATNRSPRTRTSAKQPGHLSTEQAGSRSPFSSSSGHLDPADVAPVAAHTAWVGQTGAVLATRTPHRGGGRKPGDEDGHGWQDLSHQ
jgi:uncharacterized protein (DUF305 family)